MTTTENKVTLYIATHNTTGKKYFGKTTKYFTEEDLQKYYHGSGTYWKRHITKHGDEITMNIYGIFDSIEVSEIAINFSKENNIVESNEWANLKDENGIDGGLLSDLTKEKISKAHKGIPKSDEHKMALRNCNRNYRKTLTIEHSKKISESNKGVSRNKGRKLSEETKEKMRKPKVKPRTQEHTDKIIESRKGYVPTEETKRKQSEAHKGKKKGPQVKLICPHCNKEGGASNMRRYHFENCKFLKSGKLTVGLKALFEEFKIEPYN